MKKVTIKRSEPSLFKKFKMKEKARFQSENGLFLFVCILLHLQPLKNLKKIQKLTDKLWNKS